MNQRIFADNLNFSYSSTINKIVLGLVFLLYLILGIQALNNSSDPQAWDTTAYLGEANFIKNNGGVLNFLELCVTGKYKQANQHPLYVLLITPFATTNISFFITSKIISFFIGLIFLVIFYFLTKRLIGELPAAVALFVLVLNTLFINWTTLVACESLLMLFSFLTIYYVAEGFNNNKNWLSAGIFAGLAYLTKGTSLILLPGFMISTFLVYRLKILRNKYFWSFFLFFLSVSSPLLIRNTVVYKNPFFNVNNYIVTYGIEHLEENRYVTFDPNEGATLWKFEKTELNQTDSQNNSNDSKDFIASGLNLLSRLGKSLNLFWSTFNIFEQWFMGIISFSFGILLIVFFILGIHGYKNWGGNIYYISTFLIFIFVFSFNPIDRYFLPLVPFGVIYVIIGTWKSLIKFDLIFLKKYPGIGSLNFIPYLIITWVIVYSGYLLSAKPLKNPLNSVEFSESRSEILHWLRKNLKENEKYTLGPNLNWQLERGTWILPPDNAKLKSFAKFNLFMQKHKVSYVIIDKHSLHDELLVNEGIFKIDEKIGIVENKKVENWDLVYQDYNSPIQFLIYKINHDPQ